MVKNDNEWPVVEQPFETEDDDLCPLCMEELDISDLNFRPCPCGYRICRFCWHHIKEDLNRRCPGCRKEYDDSVVEFKPMKPEELKRLQQAKKQREKERKDQELVNRKHLATVRVKQKNQVHVQGLTTKIANEDTLAQLKTSDLFASYGRIQKMFMSRRTGSTTLYTPDPRYQHVNLYINFSRNNEALACIQGIDGLTLPDGHRLKAILGSTKYCASFLRGAKCTNDNCTGAHELAEEVEGGGTAAREEMSTARHAQKESEHRLPSKTNSTHHPHPSASNSAHPIASGVALPATASWATKPSSLSQPASPAPAHAHAVHTGTSNGPTASRPFSKPPGIISASKPAHPLPPKPLQNSAEDATSRITELPSTLIGQLASHQATDTTVPGSAEKRSQHDSQLHLLQQERSSQQPEPAQSSSIVIPCDSGSNASAAISKPPPNTLSPSGSHPPGLLPPGLTPYYSGIPTNRSVPSLPPGLTHPRNLTANSASTPWPKSLDIGRPLDLKRAEIHSLDSLSDDPSNLLSSFSPNFGDSRLSICPNAEDGLFGSSKAFSPLGYSGTFNPFADTDFPFPSQPKDEDSLFGLQNDSSTSRGDSPLNDRRGSRFGFARRDSSGSPLVSSGIASSPLRSIFSHQNGDSESPKPLPSHLPRFGLTATMAPPRPQDSVAHLVSNALGDSTPDASVLFPGVNLAASYSANALPAAIARGVRSPGAGAAVGLQSIDPQIGSFQALSAAHSRDALGAQQSRVNQRLPFVNCPAALSPTSFAHMHSNNHHEHMTSSVHAARERRMDLNSAGFSLSGQYPSANEMNSEFQDPAILNLRMSNNAGINNSGAYLGAMVQGGEAGGHAGMNEIHSPFSISNAGFDHLLSNRSNPGGYRLNAGSTAINIANASENGLANQFGFQGVMHQQNVGIHGPANSIGGGTIGAAKLQQQQPSGQNFYHHSTGAPGAVVGGVQGGLMGRW